LDVADAVNVAFPKGWVASMDELLSDGDDDSYKDKKGLVYTLITRVRDLTTEEAEKIRLLRNRPDLQPFATAFDLKEDFFNIYDENPESKENAQRAFEDWERSIPDDEIFDKFRELKQMAHNFYEQIFAYWECPIAISNAYTECTNRLI
jgi:transposase